MEAGSVARVPVAHAADLIGNKWTPLILRDLATGEMRFSQLERSLAGISPKALSERLKKLEDARSSPAAATPRCRPWVTPSHRREPPCCP